ncbi:MAG: hypothetical protein PHF44_01965 [Candidatus Pacebacteria bacterium]|nr:hypothetical protein [Candidatus Paceibacterota bacterium]
MPKKITQLRFRQADRKIFNAIKSGEKRVETRAATTKFLNLKRGDGLRFVCGKDRFEKQVKKFAIFKSIDELVKKYKVKEINPFICSSEDLKKMYYSFPNYKEKIKKYGIIALELE